MNYKLIQIKPCPFCGKKLSIMTEDAKTNEYPDCTLQDAITFQCKTPNCMMQFGGTKFFTVMQAINAVNKRI